VVWHHTLSVVTNVSEEHVQSLPWKWRQHVPPKCW
jgi:hypothetical protein